MNQQLLKECLSGIIEKVTYHNPNNGFCVFKIKIKKYNKLITVTGKTPNISVGEYIKCSGIWFDNHNYGRQFKANLLKLLPPNTLEGIKKYLSSGLINGIGKHFAEKLAIKFKTDVFNVIENKPELLSTLPGIGKKRAANICNNWKNKKNIREIGVFLQFHGVDIIKAIKIFKTYGKDTVKIILKNPYKLVNDIKGVNFQLADSIAKNLGIEEESKARVSAGIVHILNKSISNGDCGLPREILINQTYKLLKIKHELLEISIDEGIKNKILVKDLINNISSIFLINYYFYEKNIAELLLILMKINLPWNIKNIKSNISKSEKKLKLKLTKNQKLSILKTIQNKVIIITGGPGTGKTTLVKIILQTLKSQKLIIKLCAPTAIAAKRLSEVTNLKATTIHRLLETTNIQNEFKYNEYNKLHCDYVIVDEASMIDVFLFHALMQAIPKHAALLIIGDIDQLPPIGAGQILKDIIQSKIITTVRLVDIFRQSISSDIIINAHKVNNGILPNIIANKKKGSFYFIEAEHNEEIINKIIIMIKDRIPKKFKLHQINDIQLLCIMQKGGTGARLLNTVLQKVLNPNYETGIGKYGQIFAINDKVMQMENDYNKEIYNGDIGKVTDINQEKQKINIKFYNRNIIYDYIDLDKICLAYAITIHKAQGSDYPAIIIPITMQNSIMLKRNLIYTGITRGKKLVVIIGQKKAFAMAVKTNSDINRYSKLKEWLLKNK